MRHSRSGWWFVCVAVAMAFPGLCAPVAWGQGASAYRIETVAGAPEGLAAEISEALQPQGVRLIRESGEVIGELWLRDMLPLESAAAGYGGLAEGTLVGALYFPNGGADFRGQPVRPGVYTLRYERIPQDGNHLGAAPEMDFLLLSPAAADPELNAPLDFNRLVELSRQATGTNHPAPLLLLPPAAPAEYPAIQTNDMGHVALRMKSRAQPPASGSTADFALAVVLVGRAEL